MADHYVDSAAAGGGDGSSGTPWNTLAQVNAHTFVAGDNIYLKRGSVFREELIVDFSGSSGAPITIDDYSTGDLPKICGADLVATWTNESGNIWYASWSYATHVVLFDGTVGAEKASKAACTAQYDWWFDDPNNRLYTYAASDPDTLYTAPGVEAGTSRWVIATDYATGKNYITINDVVLYGFSGSPAVHTVRTTGWKLDNITVEKGARTGLQMIAATDFEVVNSTLTGIRTLSTGWRAIYCYAESTTYIGGNITIHHNDITNWTGYGIDIAGPTYSYPLETFDIHNNDLSGCVTGVYVGHIDGGTIAYNTCDDNVMGPNVSGLEEYGIATSEAQNVDIHHNTCTNGRVGYEMWSWTGALWPDNGPSNNITFHHNRVSGNFEKGVMCETGNAHDCSIYHNIVYDNDWAGIVIADSNTGYESTNCTMYNNSLYNNNTDGAGYAEIYVGDPCAGWTIKNNIMYNVTGYCLRAPDGFSGVHSHNCYYKSSGNIIDNDETYYTVATGATFEATGVFADPKYTTLTAGSENLALQSDSPCIDVAADVGLTSDYAGNPIPA